jgi:hypothetical protein
MADHTSTSFTQLARTQPDLYDNATVSLYLNSPLERAGRVTNQPAMQFEQQLADGGKNLHVDVS